jgi:hypothetical protein
MHDEDTYVERFVDACDDVFTDCVARADDDSTTADEDVLVMGVGFKMGAFVALRMLARSADFQLDALHGRDFGLEADGRAFGAGDDAP